MFRIHLFIGKSCAVIILLFNFVEKNIAFGRYFVEIDNIVVHFHMEKSIDGHGVHSVEMTPSAKELYFSFIRNNKPKAKNSGIFEI